MKKSKIFLKSVICFLGLIMCITGTRVVYILVNIPDNVFVTEGESYTPLQQGLLSHMFSAGTPVTGGGEVCNDGTVKSDEVSISFLGIDVKDVTVTTVPQKYVVPCGNIIGVKIYAGGIVVAEKTPFVDENGKTASPCENTGIKTGDIINCANEKKVDNIYDFCRIVEKSDGNIITVEYIRNGQKYTTNITPAIEAASGKYKVGLTVRDSIAGIGTLTYYCPGDNTFGALGHGIECDGELFPVKNGSLENARVINVVKGRRGSPGEMHGAFTGSDEMGTILSNDETGVFGKTDEKIFSSKNVIPTASKSEIIKGDATIMCTVDGEIPKEYKIQIEKIIPYETGSKQMIIHITDDKLINKTGGIVQGMSGSPVIQNGKLVGAVTHVFVNDPTRGYGIFIENMLAEAEKSG